MATFFENLRASSKLPTRGDLQKARRYRKIAYGSKDTSADSGIAQTENEGESTETLPEVPKAPNFTYKNPSTDDRLGFWKTFSNTGVMSHYDDLMDILDKTEQMDSLEDIRNYMGQLKETNMYKILPGIQDWVDDLESFYYQSQDGDENFRYDLSYPTELMRHQTLKAKKAYENGYRSEPIYTRKMQRIPSPSELLQNIRNSYK